MRGIVVITVVSILMVIYITTAAQSTRTSKFYTKTVAALDLKAKTAKQEAADTELKQRIAEREKIAQVNTEPDERSSVESENLGVVNGDRGSEQKPILAPKKNEEAGDSEKSVAGRKMMKDDKYMDDGVATVGNTEKGPTSNVKDETEEEHAVEVELNSILKRSPIIIFSKTYCPFSKKAKHILVDKYNIVPAPYVVELDEHPLGPLLQTALGKMTGRKTVPNVLINGKSIGGGDDVAALDDEKESILETVKSMGGKRIMTAELRTEESSPRMRNKKRSRR
ncbi:MAG: hypothetical protein M1822_007990 [Bathelium mastoideum]|nr:MAG: hypothetical protein M1822_007990 [Bathelium mastoideum]